MDKTGCGLMTSDVTFTQNIGPFSTMVALQVYNNNEAKSLLNTELY